MVASPLLQALGQDVRYEKEGRGRRDLQEQLATMKTKTADSGVCSEDKDGRLHPESIAKTKTADSSQSLQQRQKRHTLASVCSKGSRLLLSEDLGPRCQKKTSTGSQGKEGLLHTSLRAMGLWFSIIVTFVVVFHN